MSTTPLHVVPYEPAARLPRGKADPAFRTKPQLAVDLVRRAQQVGVRFRAVVADSLYGENPTFESALARDDIPFVLAVRPSHGVWAPEDDPHSPPEAARRVPWISLEEPGGWTTVERRFRDGHTETWWAADLELASYGPHGYFRLVAATTDPATLPAASTWYLITNVPHPEITSDAQADLVPADLIEIVRLYGLRQWVEQGYRHVKGALGWADFEVRSDRAIQRHWQLVCCAFSFCWWAYLRRHDSTIVAEILDAGPVETGPAAVGEKGRGRRAREGQPAALVAGGAAAHPRVVGPVDHALALLARLVEHAPATGFTSAA